MVTSGSSDFDLTRTQILNSGLRKVGAIAQGESALPDMLTEASEALNVFVKNLNNEGLRLWKREWWTKTFTAASEVTGTDALIYTCIRSHTSAATDRPITGANYKSYWKQTGTTGGGWVIATAYSAIGEFQFDADVIGVEKAFLRYAGADIPLSIPSFSEYLDISSKDDFGQPSILSVEQTARFKGYLWPQPNNTDYILNVLQYTKLEDYDAAGDTSDFYQKWMRYLIFQLSADLGPEYALMMERQSYFDIKAEGLKKELLKREVEISEGQFIRSAY